eukprot:181043-Pyramimonas_sp.AAC.1
MNGHAQQGPIHFKAGIALESCRSPLLNNAVAKHLHKWLRAITLHVCGSLLRTSRRGGVPNKSGAYSTRTIKSFFSICKRKGLTAVVILLDLRQAFYPVFREFVLGKGGGKPALCRVIAG